LSFWKQGATGSLSTRAKLALSCTAGQADKWQPGMFSTEQEFLKS